MSYKQFYNLSFKQFYSLSETFNRQQIRISRQQWEIGRMISYYTVTPHLKKGSKFSPKDIAIPFDDAVEDVEQITPEEQKRQLKDVAEYYRKRDNKKLKDG